jgi:hypothetical protein
VRRMGHPTAPFPCSRASAGGAAPASARALPEEEEGEAVRSGEGAGIRDGEAAGSRECGEDRAASARATGESGPSGLHRTRG